MKNTPYLLFLLVAFLLLIESCIKNNSSDCPNPTSTYYKNIDTINIPYKKGNSFTYKDKDGNLIITKIVKDTLFYNCVLQPISNPDCGIQNSYCYIIKQYFFDTLANIKIDTYQNRYIVNFEGSGFNFLSAPLVNPSLIYYKYFDSITFNRTHHNVRLITNSQNDSLFINYNEGILKVINSENSYSIQ
jgi:hypothetical protein